MATAGVGEGPYAPYEFDLNYQPEGFHDAPYRQGDVPSLSVF